MRITEKQIQIMVACFEAEFFALKGALYLIGSRTDDNKRGGDIDLLCVVPEALWAEIDFSFKLRLKLKLSEALDDQRVDLVFSTNHALSTDPFLKTLHNKILLKEW